MFDTFPHFEMFFCVWDQVALPLSIVMHKPRYSTLFVEVVNASSSYVKLFALALENTFHFAPTAKDAAFMLI